MAPERPLLAVSRKSLDEGPKHVRASLPVEWLQKQLTAGEPEGATLGASKPGSVDVRITPAGGENFLVQGTVSATVETSCGRCLGPASVPVNGELTLMMVPSADAQKRAPKGKKSKESEGEFEFDPEEADVATYDGETLVLDDLVREAVLLELPISPLCSENCAGMRSDPAFAGVEEKLAAARVDPRLAPLAALRDKLAGAPSSSRKK